MQFFLVEEENRNVFSVRSICQQGSPFLNRWTSIRLLKRRIVKHLPGILCRFERHARADVTMVRLCVHDAQQAFSASVGIRRRKLMLKALFLRTVLIF
jgi:hypothetical protein